MLAPVAFGQGMQGHMQGQMQQGDSSHMAGQSGAMGGQSHMQGQGMQGMTPMQMMDRLSTDSKAMNGQMMELQKRFQSMMRMDNTTDLKAEMQNYQEMLSAMQQHLDQHEKMQEQMQSHLSQMAGDDE
jgi:hypothetical protein